MVRWDTAYYIQKIELPRLLTKCHFCFVFISVFEVINVLLLNDDKQLILALIVWTISRYNQDKKAECRFTV